MRSEDHIFHITPILAKEPYRLDGLNARTVVHRPRHRGWHACLTSDTPPCAGPIENKKAKTSPVLLDGYLRGRDWWIIHLYTIQRQASDCPFDSSDISYQVRGQAIFKNRILLQVTIIRQCTL